MKTLIAFYSRTGTTRKAAQAIAKLLKCDMEEIIDMNDRKGVLGYISAGKDASLKRLTKLKKTKKDYTLYDLVIVGTPIWSWSVSTPTRTYLHYNKFKRVAFFLTMGGSGHEGTFKQMEILCGKKPLATLALTTKEVVRGEFEDKTKGFVEKIKSRG